MLVRLGIPAVGNGISSNILVSSLVSALFASRNPNIHYCHSCLQVAYFQDNAWGGKKEHLLKCFYKCFNAVYTSIWFCDSTSLEKWFLSFFLWAYLFKKLYLFKMLFYTHLIQPFMKRSLSWVNLKGLFKYFFNTKISFYIFKTCIIVYIYETFYGKTICTDISYLKCYLIIIHTRISDVQYLKLMCLTGLD